MPFPPSSLADLNWFVQTTYKMFFSPLGFLWNASEIENAAFRNLLKLPVLAIVFLVVGMYTIARSHSKQFMVLFLPVILHLLASWLELYPFTERFIVFAAPLFILFIGRGADKIAGFLPAQARGRYILLTLLLAGPIVGSAMQLANPDFFGGYKKSDQREALLYVNDQFQEGDVVYVYWNVRHAYRFYCDAYKLKYQAIEGRDVRLKSQNTIDYFKKLAPDLAALAGKKRVWVIYNSKLDIDIGDDITKLPLWYTAEVKGGDKLRATIGKMGKEINTFETIDVNVSLFDLAGKKQLGYLID